MDLLGYVSRRYANHFGDLRCFQSFQIEQEDISIDGFELFDQILDLSTYMRLIDHTFDIVLLN